MKINKTITKKNPFLYMLEIADTEEFINWAKHFNIYQNSSHQGYLIVCQLIKERCLKDNIDIELLRP